MSTTQLVRVAIIGHAHSGKSTLTTFLAKNTVNPFLGQTLRLLITDVGEDVPAGLWKGFDFAIFTLYWCESALALAHDASQQQGNSFARMCVVGVNLDRIPQNVLDLATTVERGARKLATQSTSLRLFPVSCKTGVGLSELISYIVGSFRRLTPARQRISYADTLRQLLASFCEWTLDKVAAVLALPTPKDVNRSTPDPMELDDSAVEALVRSRETREWDQTLLKYVTSVFGGGLTVHKITPHLLVKDVFPPEYAAMEFVRANTRIPVPQPRYPHLKRWFAMDYVDGTMLLECWDSLSWWTQLRIACTLRGYIRQLRRLGGQRPGPLLDGTIENNALFDDQTCGPFASSTHFRVWCEYIAHGSWVNAMKYRRDAGLTGGGSNDPYPIMGGEWPLVFTHGDLNLSNVILSRDGVLWVVDWASSGFYPPWLESIGIQYSQPPASFERYRWFIAGVNPKYENFWRYFMGEVHRGFAIGPPAP